MIVNLNNKEQLIIDFMKKSGHKLDPEVLKALPADIHKPEVAYTVDLVNLRCESCTTSVHNWALFGQFRCPPKDRRNPLELVQEQRRSAI